VSSVVLSGVLLVHEVGILVVNGGNGRDAGAFVDFLFWCWSDLWWGQFLCRREKCFGIAGRHCLQKRK